MGKNKYFRKKNKWNDKKNNEKKDRNRVPYNDDYVAKVTDRGNFKMESYYALQGMHDLYYNEEGKLVPCVTDEEKEKERLRWRSISQKTLPSSFRIASDIPQSLQTRLEQEIENLFPTSDDERIKKLPFLRRAYQMTMAKHEIKKEPELAKLFEWLKIQSSAGFITRQETVSMVPPVVLDPRPDDVVFDMCASPGSKSSQLLEKLGSKGSMIANDSNTKRAFLLVHQLRRIMHNNPVALVTCCEAQFFPQTLYFDRILSDVPCSGDGTSRKNAGIWTKWNQPGAIGLHALQVDITWKGVQLLKVGGTICYSTCSHNPIENEAVVAELLRKAKGSLELVEYSLNGFKTRPGWSTWKMLVENQSRREKKNKKRKFYEKIKARREESENKQEALNEEKPSKEDKAVDTECNENKEDKKELKTDSAEKSEENIKNSDEIAKIDCDEATDNKKVTDKDKDVDDAKAETNVKFRRFETPPSWDEATLLKLAESSGLIYCKTPKDLPKELVERKIRDSCFPPTEEEAKKWHLERCIRCLAQDNNTGGFFVALLKKVAPISNRDEKAQVLAKTDHLDDGPEPKKLKTDSESVSVQETIGTTEKKSGEINNGEEIANDASNGNKEEEKGNGVSMEVVDNEDASYEPNEFKKPKDRKRKANSDLTRDDFVSANPELFEPLIKFYGLSDAFRKDQYMSRASGKKKVLYYIGDGVKKMFDSGIQARVTVVNSGVKGFTKSDRHCEVYYRICQEGVHFLAPFMSKRRVSADASDFLQCLNGEGANIDLDKFSDEFSAQIKELSVGSVVISLKGYEENYVRKMFLVMWRGRSEAINCLVNKNEIGGMKVKLENTIREEKKLSKESES